MADPIPTPDLYQQLQDLAEERNQALERVADAILRLAELEFQPDWPGKTGEPSAEDFDRHTRQGQLALAEAQERFRVTHLRCTALSLRLLRENGITLGHYTASAYIAMPTVAKA